tara:strand:+ start:28 stop:198 length:171 start_codon:yes stop_codon:yes gene_type:complete
MLGEAERKMESDDPTLRAIGFGQMHVIKAINKLIQIDGEKMTDGELVDEIYQLINE